MEFLIELVLELLFEDGKDIYYNEKVSKWIRYPIAFFLILFTSIIILGILFLGIYFLKEETLIGLFLILVSIVLIIAFLIKFKKMYMKK